MTKFSFLGELL